MCAQCTHMIWYFACYSIYTYCGNLLHIIASFDKGKHAANAFRYTQSQRWGNIIFRYSIQEGRQTNSKALLRWICQYIPKLENVQIESNQWYVLQFANWKDIWVLYCWLFHNSTALGKCINLILIYLGRILGFWRFPLEFPCGQIWHFATEPWEIPEPNLNI